MRYADGRRGRCDANCHMALGPRCPCVCGGAYHGAGEWGPALAAAVEELHALILSRLGIREHAGELVILAWRERLDGPLVLRRSLAPAARTGQLALALEPAAAPSGGARG